MKRDDNIVFISLGYYCGDLKSINNYSEQFWKVNKSYLEENIIYILNGVITGDMGGFFD